MDAVDKLKSLAKPPDLIIAADSGAHYSDSAEERKRYGQDIRAMIRALKVYEANGAIVVFREFATSHFYRTRNGMKEGGRYDNRFGNKCKTNLTLAQYRDNFRLRSTEWFRLAGFPVLEVFNSTALGPQFYSGW